MKFSSLLSDQNAAGAYVLTVSSFTPSRFDSLSRPFFELPTPFLLAIDHTFLFLVLSLLPPEIYPPPNRFYVKY
jgi:hypothetical protein